MKMNQKILFTKDECSQIIDYIHRFDISEKKYANRSIASKNPEKTYNFWKIENNDTTNWVFDKLMNWFYESTNIDVDKSKISSALIHNYKIGDAFPKHVDVSSSILYNDRLYNIGIQLSSEIDYEGGDYILYEEDTMMLLSKEIGNCYYYKSNIPHEVKLLTKGERWSFIYHITKNKMDSKHYKPNKLI